MPVSDATNAGPGRKLRAVQRRGMLGAMKDAIVAGAILAALAVAAGAMGAHGLKDRIRPELYEKAVFYHLIHAVALVLLGVLAREQAGAAFRISEGCFVGGIVLFSGSLYILALHGPKWFGAVAPIGGTALIVGWIAMAVGAWRSSP